MSVDLVVFSVCLVTMMLVMAAGIAIIAAHALERWRDVWRGATSLCRAWAAFLRGKAFERT